MDVVGLNVKKKESTTVVNNKQVATDFVEVNALIQAYYQYHN